eukprot:TRINITY_DN7432_c0_g1_i2.p2 TRINITY_DN7432_c0_g1~~TRINITY_DN7432_c0_g1_i2.p2  ORF type:complete len:117 (-),score=27.38 TRINITY_DN7432_c0_g1_i2:501-851(-)
MFEDVRNKLAELLPPADSIMETDKSTEIVKEEIDRDRNQAKLAASEPQLNVDVSAKQITVEYHNIQKATVNYYLMDIELLFSSNPFVRHSLDRFSYVAPNQSDVLNLPAGKDVVVI